MNAITVHSTNFISLYSMYGQQHMYVVMNILNLSTHAWVERFSGSLITCLTVYSESHVINIVKMNILQDVMSCLELTENVTTSITDVIINTMFTETYN